MKRAGWLHVVHRGVYAVGHRPVSANTVRMAAVLACGPGALLEPSLRRGPVGHAHDPASSYVEVTVPTRRGDIDGIRPYDLPPPRAVRTARVVDGIPCTSVALTLLNLAAVVPRRALERACDEAEVAAPVRPRRRRGRTPALPRLPRRRRGSARSSTSTRSARRCTRPGLEEAALRMMDRHELPRPEVNVRVVCGAGEAPEVDFLWRRERLVLETDGGRFHSSSKPDRTRPPQRVSCWCKRATGSCARRGGRCSATRATSR